MRWKIILAMAMAVAFASCLVATTYADYWIETFDNGPTGGFDQTWTAHDWAAASGAPAVQVYEISPATGGDDNSYYGVFGEDRTPLGPGNEITSSEDFGEFPPNAALQFSSVDAVTFDDNGGHLYVEMRINPANISARNVPFITTNMQVNTIPGDLFAEQFNFLSIERNPDQDDPVDPTTWEADVGIFNPIDFGGVESFGFAESGNDSPRPDGLESQPYTGEYLLGFWVIPNADQYASRGDLFGGTTLFFGDIRQVDGTIIAQSNDDEFDGLSYDVDESGVELGNGPVGIGFYNDGDSTLPSTYEDITIDQIVATTYYDGDFDTDGKVSGSDFLRWQSGFGTVYASPRNGDADWDADVDADDLVFWENNYGVDASSPLQSAANVPEATSIVLLLLGGLSLFGGRRR